MKLLAAILLALAGWLLFHLGYKTGLRASVAYAAEISRQAKFRESEEIKRLEFLANAKPFLEECVPIVAGSDLDEYSFCEQLLSSSSQQEFERDEEPFSPARH